MRHRNRWKDKQNQRPLPLDEESGCWFILVKHLYVLIYCWSAEFTHACQFAHVYLPLHQRRIAFQKNAGISSFVFRGLLNLTPCARQFASPIRTLGMVIDTMENKDERLFMTPLVFMCMCSEDVYGMHTVPSKTAGECQVLLWMRRKS